MIAWLKAAWSALVGFFGFWKSAATGQASEARAVDLEKHLVACIDGRQQEAARHAALIAEKDRQIQELLHDLATCNEPGAVLERWNARLRRSPPGT